MLKMHQQIVICMLIKALLNPQGGKSIEIHHFQKFFVSTKAYSFLTFW